MTYNNEDDIYDSDIAVIGMSGRFPGAKDIDEFWQNLCQGVEGITAISEEEIRQHLADSLGYVPEDVLAQWLQDPHYVKAGGGLAGIDLFDAEFFGYTSAEAELIDPQQRLFLECCWQALEDAGYDSETYKGLIGVYAGAETSSYHHNLHACLLPTQRDLLTIFGNESDYLTTRVSYKLNLRGPSCAIQCACSTSLVTVHMACESLKNGECDMALAGGVRVHATQKAGYFYREGGMLASDGHCRPFDAQAQGTVYSDGGVGVVVLKRLSDALVDGDHIYAIVKGSATNNDGALRVGFSAPSIAGQSRVISEALALADVEPATISYVEAYGSCSLLGDSVEIAALSQVFGRKTQKKQYCAIGTVKSNIGHLGAAAGIAGFIKTALALQHKQIPPSLNYKQPNPQIDFEHSPFYVNSACIDWTTTDAPRLASVNSTGIGGTNAHLILQEAPDVATDEQSAADASILVLSARTSSGLEAVRNNLIAHLQRYPELNLADVAYTLQIGRKAFPYRQMVVCQSLQDAVQTLQAQPTTRVLASFQDTTRRSIVFFFPDEAMPYVNMGRDLYATQKTFREQVDHCSELLQPQLGVDLREVLYQQEGKRDRKTFAIPALFVVSYALARLWMSWGVQPTALVDASPGQLLAGCLSNIFSLEDALSLVSSCSRIANARPEMVTKLMHEHTQLVKRVALQPPALPFISSITNNWITHEEATDPLYWTRYLRQRANFADSVGPLLKEADVLLLEVGTGQFLSALVERSGIDNQVMLHSFCPEEQQEELMHVLTTLGRLWLAGVQIDWAAVHKDGSRQRLSLPTYPFERRHYWIYPERHYHTGTQGDNKQGTTRSLRQSSSSLRARPKLTTDYTAPRNEIEEVLATLWQDMAGIDQVGVYDDFFEIGGHSLLATRLATQVGEAFQVEISPAHVIKRHTIADMAELVEMMLIQKVETMPEDEVQRLTNDDMYA